MLYGTGRLVQKKGKISDKEMKKFMPSWKSKPAKKDSWTSFGYHNAFRLAIRSGWSDDESKRAAKQGYAEAAALWKKHVK